MSTKLTWADTEGELDAEMVDFKAPTKPSVKMEVKSEPVETPSSSSLAAPVVPSCPPTFPAVPLAPQPTSTSVSSKTAGSGHSPKPVKLEVPPASFQSGGSSSSRAVPRGSIAAEVPTTQKKPVTTDLNYKKSWLLGCTNAIHHFGRLTWDSGFFIYSKFYVEYRFEVNYR